MAAGNDQAFDNLKKEIRSILMPFQKGCTLTEFRKDYRDMIGRLVPAEKFGYQDDVALLYSIPDVVSIYQQGSDYKLMVVADATTQHIQKMVAVQKPAKKKAVKSTRYNKYSPRYVPRSAPVGRPQYTGNRPSSFASSSRPSFFGNRPSPAAVNTSSFASRPSPAFSNTSTFVNSTSTFVNSTSTFVNSTSSFASRPSPAFSNTSTFVNSTSAFASRPSPAVTNTSSFVSNPIPFVSRTSVVSQPTACVSTPTTNHALEKESILAASNSVSVRNQAPLLSNPAASSSYSRQFRKNLPPRFRATSSTRLLPPDVECNIVNVVRMFPTGLRMRDFAIAYFRQISQQFSFEQYGFSTLEECLETIRDLSMKALNNNDFTIYYSGRTMTESNVQPSETRSASGLSATGNLIDFDSCTEPAPTFKKDKATEIFKFSGSWTNPSRIDTHALSENTYRGQNQTTGSSGSFNQKPGSYNFQDIPQVNEKSVYYQDNAVFKTSSSEEGHRTPRSKADALDTFELRDENVGLTENMKRKFRQIMSRNKNGIWAKDFPSTFEEVTESPFDLHSLGFSDLASLVDSVPDIFHRKRVRGSRKDWVVIPAGGCEEEDLNDADGGSPKEGALLVDCCIENIRQILEGYPEGIPLNQFLDLYSFNCNEPLYIVDLGFDCIENFLLSISERVPLKIELEGGCKTIFLDETEPEDVDTHVPALLEEDLPESIPYDAASPDCQYKKLDLPLDIGTSKFVPVFTSEILHPGQMYIQLEGPDTSKALKKLYDDLELFYNGPHSEHYLLQRRHMKEGAMCAALWPKDQLWYRVIIISFTSEEAVRVFYVDYGTTDVVSRALLRYLKESYTKLPAQALKACLAHVIPANKASRFSSESKERMLHLCRDVSLMAQVKDIKDGVLSLVLCDTRDKNDLFINDILMKEGLVDSVLDKSELAVAQPEQQSPVFDPIHMMQAHCFYQMFNSLSLTMSPDQVAKAMQPLSLNYLDNPLVTKTPDGAAFQSPSNAAGYQSPPGAAASQSFPGAAFFQSLPGAAALSVGALALDHPSSCAPNSSISSRESPVDDSDIFEDDDDFFQDFCQKSFSVSKRYVKRIRTEDAYFFHILIVDAQPCVSSGDISTLIWSDKQPEHLLERLETRDVVFESRSISKEGNEEMFIQFEKFHVQGIQKGSKTTCIIIYPLQSAIAILNEYGHPSVKLRQTIMNEIESFNLNLPAWQELSENEIPEEVEKPLQAVTDDDKLNRLCIFDLLAMKDAIRHQKNSLLKDLKVEDNTAPLVDKLEKLESLYQRVALRIVEILRICETFSW